MSYSFLIFDFGSNEDLAQQARHRIEGWKQGFRLDKKLQIKFDRKEPQAKPEDSSSDSSEVPKSSSKSKANSKGKSSEENDRDSASSAASPEIRMIVRLDFSDHEKLSHQRWLERIPKEELFKDAQPKVVIAGDPAFETTLEQFDLMN